MFWVPIHGGQPPSESEPGNRLTGGATVDTASMIGASFEGQYRLPVPVCGVGGLGGVGAFCFPLRPSFSV